MPEALTAAEFNADNELIERDGTPLEYDKDGHLLSEGTQGYEWNARGQLASISGAEPASFGYDPFGRRYSKTLEGVTTELLFDGENVAQESVVGSTTATVLARPGT